MKKLYLIAYDTWISRDDIVKCLSNAVGEENCFDSMPHSLFVLSSLTARALYEKVKAAYPRHGRFYVTESPQDNAYGWMPKSHWQLINENSTVHDYQLVFDGYWVQGRERSLPAEAGIYCVYAASHDRQTDRVRLVRLLYIGKSVDVRARHQDHEGVASWRAKLSSGEILCYSFAPLAKQSLPICEAAMIFKHQPICNDVCKDSFSHGTTRVRTSGRNACLMTDFTVGRDSVVK